MCSQFRFEKNENQNQYCLVCIFEKIWINKIRQSERILLRVFLIINRFVICGQVYIVSHDNQKFLKVLELVRNRLNKVSNFLDYLLRLTTFDLCDKGLWVGTLWEFSEVPSGVSAMSHNGKLHIFMYNVMNASKEKHMRKTLVETFKVVKLLNFNTKLIKTSLK